VSDPVSQTTGLRVLVCGGRDYSDRGAVFAALDRLKHERGVACVIHGDASGADYLAGEWAEGEDIPVLRFPADWQRYGRAAGPKRNAMMLVGGKPDGVVAFPGGRGTADMVRQAEVCGVPVWRPVA
jgi:hypothetical protein